MSARRTDMHRLQEMVRLHRLGKSVRVVARRLQMGRDNVRLYQMVLRQADLLDGNAAEQPEAEALRAAVVSHRPSQASPQQTTSFERWRTQVAEMLARRLALAAA
jgi:hypothetical protein